MPLLSRPRLRPLLVVWMDAAQVAPHLVAVHPEKHCLECTEAYFPAHAKQQYCSRSCSNRASSRAKRGKARIARKTRKCPSCGEMFKLPLSAPAQKYCSKPCWGKGRPNTRVKRTCRMCKARFEVYPSIEKTRGRAKFCSNKCKHAYRRKHMPAKVRRNYVDNLFSRLVRQRDGACLYCGTTEALHCSHVISRSVSVLRADFDNAITLCHRHHLYFWHKDPIAAARWFEEKWPGRYDRLLAKSQQIVKMDWHAEFDRLRQVEAEWTGKQVRSQPRRTHCSKGHALTEDNRLKRGGCKKCHRDREAARRSRAELELELAA